MSSPTPIHSDEKMKEIASQLERLHGGGGGGSLGGDGGDGGMNERIAKLEANVGHIQTDISQLRSEFSGLRSDIGDVRSTLAAISAKLDSKVDYKWLTIYIMGIVAVILREEIAALFG